MINAYTIMMAIVVGAAYFMHGDKQFNKRYIIFSAIAMFILMGFRDAYSVGNDSASSYLHTYEKITYQHWSQIFNSTGDNEGFYLLMKIVNAITDANYQIFIIVISAFIMIVIARFIYIYSCNPLQSIIYYWGLWFYIFNFNALKQALAMSIILLAFDMIQKKKVVWFLLLVLLAMTFHKTAMVFIIAYWVVKLKPGRNFLLLLAAMLAFTYIFRSQMLDFMTGIYETTIYDTGRGFFANKVIIMIVIVAAGLILRPPEEDDELYNNLLMFMGIAIVFQTFSTYNNTFERLGDYYFQFAIIFIPLVFQRKPLQRSYFQNEAALNTIKQIAPVLFCGFGIWRMANQVLNDATLRFKFCF